MQNRQCNAHAIPMQHEIDVWKMERSKTRQLFFFNYSSSSSLIGVSFDTLEVSLSLGTLLLGFRGRNLRPSSSFGCSKCSVGSGLACSATASGLTRSLNDTKSGFSWSPKLMPTVTLGRIRRFCSRPRCFRIDTPPPSLSLSSAERLLAVLWRDDERDDISRGLKVAGIMHESGVKGCDTF